MSKKNEVTSDLSFWYGFDVAALPRERQLGLMANLSRVQSQSKLFHRYYEATDFEGVYQLYLDAYGDEELAQKAQTQAAKNLLNTPRSETH